MRIEFDKKKLKHNEIIKKMKIKYDIYKKSKEDEIEKKITL